jgi:hypothetical protein
MKGTTMSENNKRFVMLEDNEDGTCTMRMQDGLGGGVLSCVMTMNFDDILGAFTGSPELVAIAEKYEDNVIIIPNEAPR